MTETITLHHDEWENVLYDGSTTMERRFLKKGDNFQLVFTSLILVVMFALLLLDKFGPDHIMAGALALFLAADIVNMKEGLAGFSNEGVLTVMVLFVVAEGITKTGALDWYMTKLLGKPKSIAVAQLRMMIPVAVVSAFFNNTPIVVIMIPVLSKWCKHANIPVQQMMIPLSYATILGGTITTIGTSTNLVVTGLLKDAYPGDPEAKVSLFDLAPYGLPFGIAGLAFILAGSPFLLPKGPYRKKTPEDEQKSDDSEDVLLRARVTQWSPAAGRSVKRSGLREAGGLFLVSVQRAATGNIHRAVGQEFILNVNDILYFTGLLERFGEFCEEHGLEVVTNEMDEPALGNKDGKNLDDSDDSQPESGPAERLRKIHRLTDMIQDTSLYTPQDGSNPQEVVVTSDQNVVFVGIDAMDRPGLLKDITKVFYGLQLELHHSEAAVVRDRSISVWRCENLSQGPADYEKIASVVQALLDEEMGVQASKREGLSVIRAQVTAWSSLVGRTVEEVDFRADYKAAVVAVQKDGKNVLQSLSSVTLSGGDVLVLQAAEDSPLLTPPPEGFYKRMELAAAGKPTHEDEELDIEVGDQNVNAWKDLQVTFSNFSDDGVVLPREFLTAMVVAPKTRFVNKSVVQLGLDKLPSVILVSIERPASYTPATTKTWYSFLLPAAEGDVTPSTTGEYNAIALDEPLREGDVLWYSGIAKNLGELRRIPGLLPFTNDQVVKLGEKLHDRRLVEAVVARNGPLVGHTVKEAQFRTRYGAAVIGVHRDGKRIHDYPGNVKLRAGDVLLLEAGPHFFGRRNNERSFALFVEVEDSAPPRLHLIIPAGAIVITMIAVYVAKDISLLICASLASALLIIIGVLSEQEARNSLNWEIYVTVAAAFGIGSAMTNSGVAGYLAKFLVNIGNAIGVGDAGVIGAVYVATTLISELVTNNAAAALVFPIAMNAANKSGVSIRIMAFAVMLGSSDFATPYGYQCNLLVYGPGRYKFIDYIKIGIPLQIILFFTATICLALPLNVWWATTLVTLAALIVVSVVRIGYDTNAHFLGGNKKSKAADKASE